MPTEYRAPFLCVHIQWCGLSWMTVCMKQTMILIGWNDCQAVCTKTPILLPRGSESRMWKLRLHYGDFVQENFNMADKTAGKLETVLRVNKASAKVFEPRTS